MTHFKIIIAIKISNLHQSPIFSKVLFQGHSDIQSLPQTQVFISSQIGPLFSNWQHQPPPPNLAPIPPTPSARQAPCSNRCLAQWKNLLPPRNRVFQQIRTSPWGVERKIERVLFYHCAELANQGALQLESQFRNLWISSKPSRFLWDQIITTVKLLKWLRNRRNKTTK